MQEEEREKSQVLAQTTATMGEKADGETPKGMRALSFKTSKKVLFLFRSRRCMQSVSFSCKRIWSWNWKSWNSPFSRSTQMDFIVIAIIPVETERTWIWWMTTWEIFSTSCGWWWWCGARNKAQMLDGELSASFNLDCWRLLLLLARGYIEHFHVFRRNTTATTNVAEERFHMAETTHGREWRGWEKTFFLRSENEIFLTRGCLRFELVLCPSSRPNAIGRAREWANWEEWARRRWKLHTNYQRARVNEHKIKKKRREKSKLKVRGRGEALCES